MSAFFCGGEIEDRVSLEHIFGDSFLGYLDLKMERLASSQPHPTSYSKVKVPAHRTCNNRDGSWFESYVLAIIKTVDQNPDHLRKLHVSGPDKINRSLRQAFTQWLAKLYYGLIYWEAGRKSHANPEYQRWLVALLSDPEFAYLRRCFTRDIGFRVPSSLFYFEVPDVLDPGFRFDFATGLPHGLLYIRFRKHLLVAALGDGRLVHEWFSDEHVKKCQRHILEQSVSDPVAYLHAVAHIWAVRELLPVGPIIEFHEGGVSDRSRERLDQLPPIDG